MPALLSSDVFISKPLSDTRLPHSASSCNISCYNSTSDYFQPRVSLPLLFISSFCGRAALVSPQRRRFNWCQTFMFSNGKSVDMRHISCLISSSFSSSLLCLPRTTTCTSYFPVSTDHTAHTHTSSHLNFHFLNLNLNHIAQSL